MLNLTKLEFAALDISGKNYLSWTLDTEIHLEAKNLGDTIKDGNQVSLQDRAKSMIFILGKSTYSIRRKSNLMVYLLKSYSIKKKLSCIRQSRVEPSLSLSLFLSLPLSLSIYTFIFIFFYLQNLFLSFLFNEEKGCGVHLKKKRKEKNRDKL